jgi:hypothetical protein
MEEVLHGWSKDTQRIAKTPLLPSVTKSDFKTACQIFRIITVITIITLVAQHSLHCKSRTAEQIVYFLKAAEGTNLIRAENKPTYVKVKGHYTTIKSTHPPTNVFNKMYF